MITVGIIGTGFGSKVHLPTFQYHNEFDVKSISGRKEEKTKEIAEDAGIEYTTNWKEMLTDDDIDLITVSTPPYHHFDMGMAVLKAEKHLLLEKPTTTTAHEAKLLLREAEARGLTGLLSHEFRWLPARNYFAHIVGEQKKIGEIQEVHYQSFYPFGASEEQPAYGWLWNSLYDGGMLGAIGSHLVDQIRHTTQLEFKSVKGKIHTRTPRRKDEEGKYHKVTADDGFQFLFELDNNVTGHLNVTTTTAPAPTGRFIVSGSEGTAYLEDNTIHFGSIDDDEFEHLHIPDEFEIDHSLEDEDRRIPPFIELARQLAKSIDRGESLSPNLEDGWRNQLVLDAVRKSQSTGSEVNIVDYL